MMAVCFLSFASEAAEDVVVCRSGVRPLAVCSVGRRTLRQHTTLLA